MLLIHFIWLVVSTNKYNHEKVNFDHKPSNYMLSYFMKFLVYL